MADPNDISTIEYYKRLIGIYVDSGTHLVTKEQIMEYAKSIGETNPLYLDEETAAAGPHGAIIAPPFFFHTFGNSSVQTGQESKIRFGTTSLHASQKIETLEPICAGDILRLRTKVSDVYTKTGRTGTMVFIVRSTTFTNQHGRTVMVAESSSVRMDLPQ